MSQYDVYLAGSMTGRFVHDVLFERSLAKIELRRAGLTWYDPADNEGLDKRDPFDVISNSFDKRRMERFVKKDLAAVAECRSILNITGDLPSDGCNWEMAYAVFYRHIPVHLIAPLRKTGVKMSFTNILADGIHKDMKSAIKAIQKSIKENQ